MKKLILLIGIIFCCLSAGAQNNKSLNGPLSCSANTPLFDITDISGPSSVVAGTTYTYTAPSLPVGYLAKWELVGQGYTDTVDFTVDDDSTVVYFNTMSSGTATATLRLSVKAPTGGRAFIGEKEITISAF